MSQILLLDTQAFILAMNSPKDIPAKVQKLLNQSKTEIYLSLASVWELSIKSSLGKIKFNQPLKTIIQSAVTQTGLKLLPIEAKHIYLVESFPFHHKDPFDRLIAAQAIVEKLSLVGSDQAFDAYGVKRIW